MASLLGPDAKRDPDAVLFVDVGGSKGHEAMIFHTAHPDIPGRLILQDVPSVIDQFRKDPSQGIELMPYDFFTTQPIKGQHLLPFIFSNFFSALRGITVSDPAMT